MTHLYNRYDQKSTRQYLRTHSTRSEIVRQKRIEQYGIHFPRVSDDQIFGNIENVCAVIEEKIRELQNT